MTCTDKRHLFPFKTNYSVNFFTALFFAAFVALTSSSFLFAQNSESALLPPDVATENWVFLSELDPELLSTVPAACCGLYINSDLPPIITDGSLQIEAANGSFDSNDQEALISGGIDIRFADIWLQSEQGIYDKLDGIVELSGNIRLRQAGLSIGATTATVNTLSASSQLRNTSYVLHQLAARGNAELLTFNNADKSLLISEGTYTVCEPGDDTWLLVGSEIELDQNSGRGTGRDIVLRVKNIPVFYTPYLSFPINDERSSGLLYPSIGSTREGGFDYAQPYYFNLAPNYDATLTPRLMSERGLMMSLEGRHLGSSSSNELRMSYLHDDAQYDPLTVAIPGTESPPEPKRWQVNYLGAAEFTHYWSARANFSAISDFDYFQDFGNAGLSDTTRSYLYRQGALDYHQQDLQIQAALESFQQIDPSLSDLNKPYSSLPRINLNYRGDTGKGPNYGVQAEYVYFDRQLNEALLSPAQIDNGILVSGQRLSLQPRLSWRWQSPGSFLEPGLSYDYTHYQFEQQALGNPKQLDRGILSADLDSGLIFERPLSFRGQSLTQTLEPRVFYLYRDYENQDAIPLFDTANLSSGYTQLFRDNRFSGRDRIGDANQLTLALSSRLLDSSGREKARLSLGQILYFEDRRVSLSPGTPTQQDSSSAFVSEFSYQLNENWRLGLSQQWNPQDSQFDSGSFQFRYQSDINQLLNLSYRYRDSSNIPGVIKQTDISALWPLTDSVGLIGRWNYDHTNQRSLEAIIGLEYTSCCWNLRLIARQWVDNSDPGGNFVQKNNGIFLQFELKGLGNILGNSIESLLGNSISGFKNYAEIN